GRERDLPRGRVDRVGPLTGDRDGGGGVAVGVEQAHGAAGRDRHGRRLLGLGAGAGRGQCGRRGERGGGGRRGVGVVVVLVVGVGQPVVDAGGRAREAEPR